MTQYDYDLEKRLKPENFLRTEEFEDPEEYIKLCEEATKLYPHLGAQEIEEVVVNFLIARDANPQEGL